MQKYQDSVVSTSGRAITTATVLVKTLAGATATIYSDDGVTTQTNPITVGSDGEYSFYAANGRYTLTITASGYEIETRSDIVLFDPYTDAGDAGFWVDDTPETVVQRQRDRIFMGAAAAHTGRRTAPYGGTALSENIATWPEKNAQAVVGSTNGRTALLGWTNLSDADTSGSSIAVAGFARAKKSAGTSRGFYADVTRESGAAAVYGLEVATTNRGSDVTGNSYGLSEAGAVYGLHIAHEGSTGYTVTDSDTAVSGNAAPGTAAINIIAGSGGTALKRWNMGIRFGLNAITGTDGVTGAAQAIQLAKGHEINWMASSTIQGAKIRSDVTAVSGYDVSMIFEPGAVSFYGTSDKKMFRVAHTANGVNNVVARNAVTGSYPLFQAEGDDAAVGMFFSTKGQGRYSFLTNSTANEDFRVGGVVNAPLNYLHAYGRESGAGYAVLEAKGADTNIDLSLITKGTGVVKFGTHSALAAETVTGYITIKDAAGNSRKLAVVS